MSPASPAKFPRSTAVHVLTRVLTDHEAVEEAIDHALAGAKAEPGTRVWLQEVCSGTLRWKGRLDLALDSVALKKKPTGWLRKVLLVAAYQLIAQDRTSPKSVVIETVDEVRDREGDAPARFANAVLRKLADHAAEWRELPCSGPNEASLPDWIWKRVRAERGAPWAEAFARACLERPRTWIRKREPDWSPDWAETPAPLSPGTLGQAAPEGSALAREGGAIPAKAGFAEGSFIVQDISSQRLVASVARLARERLGAGPLKALDLCAAPGGKSVGLSWSGFDVTATDRSPGRMQLLEETVRRVGAPIRRLGFEEALAGAALFDLVWVDAPCSGSGIIRRHPEVRWAKGEKELQSLLKIQRELLARAWAQVKPGGALVYTVCSVLEEEGPRAIQDAQLAGAAFPVPGGWLLAPQDEPFGDGFWGTFALKAR